MAENDESFYKSFDNGEEFHQFKNQIKNPVEEHQRSTPEFYGDDDLHETFSPEDREHVEFDISVGTKERADNFKKTLKRFEIDSIENHFFYSVIYGLMFQKTKKPDLDLAKEILGSDFYSELKEIEPYVVLDHTFFGFFERCTKMNKVLPKFGYFFRFYERRNKFRYELRQKLRTKNEMKAELSACIIQEFNGYELLRSNLKYSEKKNLSPIDIVYEPTLNTEKPIECFFTDEIHLGFNTSYDKFVRGNKKKVKCHNTKQCPYCNNFFMKAEKKMLEHINSCAGQAGFSFSFDNGKIINYQDNFKKIGDLPFAVYYDFETTAGRVVFLDAKIYVASYCIIIAFHPDLNLPCLYIYRSYDQSNKDLTSLHHFDAAQRNFFYFSENFNLKTLKQLQNATLAVENKKDNTALAEMFNIELRFTVDCLKFWFQRNLKKNELFEEQRD